MALGLIAALVVAWLPVRAAAAPTEIIQQVHLGDSYSAGNGAGGYSAFPTGCRRTNASWGMQVGANLQKSGKYTVFSENHACSRAIAWDVDHEERLQDPDGTTSPWQEANPREKTAPGPDHTCADLGPDYIAHFNNRRLKFDECKYFLRPQTDWVTRSTDLVTLTIGGNDLGFGGVVGKCLILEQLESGWIGSVPGVNFDKSCESYLDTAQKRLRDGGSNGLRARTRRVLEEIESRMDPNGLIVLSGYPSLIDNTTKFRGSVPADTAQRIRDRQLELDAMQSALVTELNNAAGEHPKLVFTSPLAEFYGHEILTPGVSLTKPNPDRWFIAPVVDASPLDYDLWYHPNKTGHTAWAVDAARDLPAAPPADPVGGERRPLDLVFVIDTTGSMGDDIDEVKAQSVALLNSLDSVSVSWRAAVVSYRDFPDRSDDPGDYPAKLISGFSSDRSTVTDAINSLDLGDGGDSPETMYSGIMAALDLPWRAGVDKRLVVMTDARALDPEPTTGYTAAQVAARALAVDPVQVVGVGVGGAQPADLPELQELVATAGGVVTSAEPGASGTEVVDAVKSVVEDPRAWIEGPIVGKPGETLHLNGGDSIDPAGSITSYEWDVDGDGTVDASRTTPTLDVRFNKAFSGTLTLRVVSSSGRSNTATASIRVTARPSSSYTTSSGFLRPLGSKRLLDTKKGVGAARGPVKAKKKLTVKVGGRASVPKSASGVALDVSVSSASAAGSLTVYPCGATRPKVATMSFAKSGTTSKLVVSGLGDGNVCFYSSKRVHLTASTSGYLDFGLDYHWITTKRVLDSAKGTGVRKHRVNAKETVTVTLPGSGAAEVPFDAKAALLTLTAKKSAKAGTLTVWPCGATRPTATTVAFGKAKTSSSLDISGIGAGRKICLRSSSAVDLLADLHGFLPAEASYVPAVPTVVLDTAKGVGARKARVGAGRTVKVAVPPSLLPDALGGTLALSVTATPGSKAGSVKVWACDSPKPSTAKLRFAKSTPGSNQVLTTLKRSGKLCIAPSASTHLSVVANGAFAAAEPGGGTVTVIE